MFPYRFALRDSETGETRTDGAVKAGEVYGLVLCARPEELERGVERRYVYVFAIDSFGDSTLLFPTASGGNVENRVPYDASGEGGFPAEIALGKPRLFKVGPPFGVDTYILLSTVQAIPDPTVLEFGGVRKRGRGLESASPLARLFATVGSARRGVVEAPPPRLVYRPADPPELAFGKITTWPSGFFPMQPCLFWPAMRAVRTVECWLELSFRK
jgi:hypothetical protein